MGVLTITDLENDPLENLNFDIFEPEPILPIMHNSEIHLNFPAGWNMIGMSKKVSSLHNYMNGTVQAGHSALTMSEFISKNLLDANGNPIPYNQIINYVVIAKDNNGVAWLPEWNFDGVGELHDFMGYQIKFWQPCKLIIKGENHVITSGPNIARIGADLVFGTNNGNSPFFSASSGWAMLGFPITEPVDITSVFSGQGSNIVIAKNYLGAAWLPEWNFNGIGDIEPGVGYQLKWDTEQINFSGEQIHITIPVIETYHVGSFIDWNLTSADLQGGFTDTSPYPDGFAPPDGTLIAAEVTIKGEDIHTFVFDHGFDVNHYEILELKERYLQQIKKENWLIENPGQSGHKIVLDSYIEALYSPTEISSNTAPSATQQQELPKDLVDQLLKGNDGKVTQFQKNPYYTTEYPYFTYSYKNYINSEFSSRIGTQNINILEEYKKDLLQQCNFYISARDVGGKTYSDAKNGLFKLGIDGNFARINMSLVGDDPLTTASEGFSDLDPFVLVLSVQSRRFMFNNFSTNYQLNTVYDTAESKIEYTENLGRYSTDSQQVVESIKIQKQI